MRGARARAYFTTWKATGLSYQHNSKSRGHHPGAQNFWLWSQYHKTIDVASRWLKHVDFGPSVNRSHQKLTIFQQHLGVWHFVSVLYSIIIPISSIVRNDKDNSTKSVAVWWLKRPKTLFLVNFRPLLTTVEATQDSAMFPFI